MWVFVIEIFLSDEWEFVEILMESLALQEKLLFILVIISNHLDIRPLLYILFDPLRHRNPLSHRLTPLLLQRFKLSLDFYGLGRLFLLSLDVERLASFHPL